MPVVIRRIVNDGFENLIEITGESWELRTQIEALEEWLSSNQDQLNPADEWIADVGFTMRRNANGGGPPITRKLMKLCIASNLEIYLSEYGTEE